MILKKLHTNNSTAVHWPTGFKSQIYYNNLLMLVLCKYRNVQDAVDDLGLGHYKLQQLE